MSVQRGAELLGVGFDEEAGPRRDSLSSIDLGIASKSGELFVAMPPELLALVEEVHRAEREFAVKFSTLPTVARRAFVRGLVLDEVVSTNAIEDIRSTRKQVARALETTSSSSRRGRRFREIALLYLSLGEGEGWRIKSPADIRSVYDRVMDGEDLGANAPDGKLFRVGGVEVVGPGDERVHEGLEPEAKIVEALEGALRLLDRTDAPQLVLAMAAHYLFEFAHPFYDGNGRTGRYLLSLRLSDSLSIPTVLSLSRAILERREGYCRAFRQAEEPLNRGELTFFVMDMLKMLRAAQDGASLSIDRACYLSQTASERLAKMAMRDGIPPREREVLEALVQIELFENTDSVSVGILPKRLASEPRWRESISPALRSAG